jgi:fumarylacetoacetase
LGPFLAKNFGTVISPWVVPTLALENFRVSTPEQSDVVPLDYLKQSADEKGGFDIDLSVTIESGEAGPDGKMWL